MLRLVMRATVIAVVLVVGFVLYLVYQEEQTPRWPTAATTTTATTTPGTTTPGTTTPAPAQASAPSPTATPGAASPLSPLPSAPNAGTVTPAAPTASGAATPGAATPGQAPATPTDPLSAALQQLRQGDGGVATPPVGGQITVTPVPNTGGTSTPPSSTVPPPGTSPSPTDQSAGSLPTPLNSGAPGSLPPGTPSALGTADQQGALPPPIPLTPPSPSSSGGASSALSNLPNTTGAGTHWALIAGNGGMSVNIDLGNSQLARVVVAPQFANLDHAGMEDRVNWLRQSILARWGAQGGTYIYRRDGSIFRPQ